MVFSSIIQQHQFAAPEPPCIREKKLDLNAPLMSVRRHHNGGGGGGGGGGLETTASQSDDEQQQMQQQSNNYAYPNHHHQQQQSSEADDDHKDEDEEAAGWGSLRSPGAVPFVWERTPGRPKTAPHNDNVFVACSSPSLPPGRTTTWSSSASPRTDPNRNSPVADLKGHHPKKKQPPLLLLKESPHRKHKKPSLAELFGKKRAIPTNCEISDDDDHVGAADHHDGFFSEGNLMADPRAQTKNSPCWDDPGARDFILKRFLPAAKAMADESASSSPFSAPLVSLNSNNNNNHHHQHVSPRFISSTSPSSSSPRKQVSASVERIQTYQYKFANRSQKRSSSSSSHEDFFALKACGFLSFNFGAAFRHLRPNYPSSRLKRSSDRANNRFASDDFHTSILVKQIDGGLTIKHEEELSETETEDDPRSSQQKHHQLRKDGLKSQQGFMNSSPHRFHKSPGSNQEHFYDCDTSFSNQEQAKTPGRSSYYRGSISPSMEESKGFLGLPETYKPPEDPYRHGGFSPSLHQKTSSRRAELEKERNASSLAMMNARNQSSLAQRLDTNLRFDTENSNADSSPSPGSRNGMAAAEIFSCSAGSSSQEQQNKSSWPANLDGTNAQRRNPGRNIAAASPLLPPKSPSQSWLWKALPVPPSVRSDERNENWEATVKSRHLRPGHLRYSEENALQPCEY